MNALLRWIVPDRITPTPLDELFLGLEVALMRLPIVLDSLFRKAMLAPSWSDFHDMTTADEKAIWRALRDLR